MTEQRKEEIERVVFYKHIEEIMRTLEECDDSDIVFQLGMDLGRMKNDLDRELEKELSPRVGLIIEQ